MTLNQLKKCEGEATANNRKAKLIFLFEWDLKLDFVGELRASTIIFAWNYIDIMYFFQLVLEVPNRSIKEILRFPI